MLGIVIGLVSCGVDMPKETQSSFETMTVKTTPLMAAGSTVTENCS